MIPVRRSLTAVSCASLSRVSSYLELSQTHSCSRRIGEAAATVSLFENLVHDSSSQSWDTKRRLATISAVVVVAGAVAGLFDTFYRRVTKEELDEGLSKLSTEIKSLDTKICQVDTKLSQEIKHVETKLSQDIKHLDTKICQVDTKLSQEIKHVETKLSQEIKHVETKLSQDIKHLETKMELRFGQIDTRFGQIDTRLGQIDSKIDRLINTLLVVHNPQNKGGANPETQKLLE